MWNCKRSVNSRDSSEIDNSGVKAKIKSTKRERSKSILKQLINEDEYSIDNESKN